MWDFTGINGEDVALLIDLFCDELPLIEMPIIASYRGLSIRGAICSPEPQFVTSPRACAIFSVRVECWSCERARSN